MPSIMSVLGTAGRSLREGVFEPRILQQAQQRTDLKKKEQRQTEADFIIEAREAWLALDQEMLNNVLEKYKRAVPTQTFRTIAENITKAINLVKTERANKAAKKADEPRLPFPKTPEGELDVDHVATVSDPGFQFLQERLRKQGLTPEEADTEIQKAYKASPQMMPMSDLVKSVDLQSKLDARSGRQQQADPRIVKSFVDAIIADPSTSISILSSDIISQNTRSAILNELSSRPDFNLRRAFEAHEDAKKRPEGFQIIGGRRIPYNLYKSVEKRAIDVLKTEAGKKAWGAQDKIPYDKIQAKIIELLSTMEFGNGATQSTSGGSWSNPDDPMHTVPEFPIPDTSGVDTPTAADTVSAVPDTSGVDTLTAGVPPPTPQQGSETFRYTDPALAQKLIDYLRAMKLQVANNVAGEIVHGERVEISGQATPIQKKAVEAWKKALDSLRIP